MPRGIDRATNRNVRGHIILCVREDVFTLRKEGWPIPNDFRGVMQEMMRNGRPTADEILDIIKQKWPKI